MPLFPLLESGGGVLRRFGLPGRGPVFSSAALWGYGEFFVWFAGIPLDLLLCGKNKMLDRMRTLQCFQYRASWPLHSSPLFVSAVIVLDDRFCLPF